MVDEPTSGCTVTVCRDCCCGSPTKHPQVDHEAQLAGLRAALTPAHRVRTSLCLDVCSQSNVMVVQPAPAARRSGARPVWFGLVVDEAVTADLVAWVRVGGPGRAPIPATLELSVISPPAQADAGDRASGAAEPGVAGPPATRRTGQKKPQVGAAPLGAPAPAAPVGE